MAEFNFSLSTRQREFAEKMHMRANAILAELQEPKDKEMELFELFETEDFQWGIGCVCHDSSAKAHEQALKQVVAEFPEIKMTTKSRKQSLVTFMRQFPETVSW